MIVGDDDSVTLRLRLLSNGRYRKSIDTLCTINSQKWNNKFLTNKNGNAYSGGSKSREAAAIDLDSD